MYLYNYRRIMSTLYSYPLNLNTSESRGNGDHRITFTALQQRFGATTNGVRPGDMVAMYLPPDALKTSYSQSYGDVEMGGLGQAILGSNVNNDQLETSLRQGMQGNIGAAMQTLGEAGKGTPIAAALSTAVAKEISSAAGQRFGSAVQALERKVGKIRNPHKALIYQGPGGFRTFSFTFVMMPKSKKEAEEINKIVHFFKYHMHPGVEGVRQVPGAGASSQQVNRANVNNRNNINSSLTLSYPEEFRIRVTPRGLDGDTQVGSRSSDGKANQVRPLFRIEKCFLESLNVDYTTSGQPVFFDDGTEPVTTTLALSFKETQLMTKESIRQGF